MIYLDNAATSLLKPPEVAQAVVQAIDSFGGVGRGVHPASIAAGRAVFEARTLAARILGAPFASCVSFALNATMALNIALQGLVQPGARIVTTAAAHNSILRPLFRLRDERDCTIEIAPICPDGSLDWVAYERLFSEGPVNLVAATHASNLTGDIYDVARMAHIAHDHGALFVLDAAQTAGAFPLSMTDLDVDVLCFTGHKSLLGPQGTGGLCVNPDIEIPPLIEGGSGTHTFDERHPRFMPESLEAGTPNAHGLAGLAAGMRALEVYGIDRAHERADALARRFIEGIEGLTGVQVLGRSGTGPACAIVALDVDGVSSADLGDMLANDYGICTRAGAHCAPLMHRALGTEARGAVRFSFSHLNADSDVESATMAVRESLMRLKAI